MSDTQIGDARLILGNSLNVMQTLSQVDHTICDPPYEDHMHDAKRDLVKNPGRGRKKAHGARRIRTDGHANPPPVDFPSITAIRQEVAHLTVKLSRRWLLAFCTPEGVAAWRDAIETEHGRYKRACVWVKPDSAPQFNGQGPAMGAEMIVTAWCGTGFSQWNGGGRRNVFTHNCQPRDRTGEHPTEKPLSLMRELIELFTSPGDTVLDPFMGAGSTGVACLQLGRRFIGIEMHKDYYELACRRMTAVASQATMFEPGERWGTPTMEMGS